MAPTLSQRVSTIHISRPFWEKISGKQLFNSTHPYLCGIRKHVCCAPAALNVFRKLFTYEWLTALHFMAILDMLLTHFWKIPPWTYDSENSSRSGNWSWIVSPESFPEFMSVFSHPWLSAADVFATEAFMVAAGKLELKPDHGQRCDTIGSACPYIIIHSNFGIFMFFNSCIPRRNFLASIVRYMS